MLSEESWGSPLSAAGYVKPIHVKSDKQTSQTLTLK